MFAEVPTYKFSKNINIVLSASSLGARSLGAYRALSGKVIPFSLKLATDDGVWEVWEGWEVWGEEKS